MVAPTAPSCVTESKDAVHILLSSLHASREADILARAFASPVAEGSHQLDKPRAGASYLTRSDFRLCSQTRMSGAAALALSFRA